MAKLKHIDTVWFLLLHKVQTQPQVFNHLLRKGQAAGNKQIVGDVRNVVKKIESRNKTEVVDKEVGSKVKELASKLGVKLKDNNSIPAVRKK